MPVSVGASLLAMDVNDYACLLDKRVALRSIASKLAPTIFLHSNR
jgi:putative Mg2+ transporter-C (MgtC) family protein